MIGTHFIKTLIALTLLPGPVFAQTLDWARTMGGPAGDLSYAIAADGAGNVYTTGVFNLTADMDPGTGTFNLTSQGSFEVFVQKMDASGNFAWAKGFGGNGFDAGTAIATDGLGNVYVTGYFSGTVDFDPGPGTFLRTSAGLHDAFTVKLDSNGDLVWAKTFGGSLTVEPTAIAVDSVGNAYITGYFEGIMDADPNTGHILSSNGGEDAFVLQLDTAGTLVWAVQFGGAADDQSLAIDLDPFGNIALTGYFQLTVDFDPTAAIFALTSNGARDVYVLKLTGSGDFEWALSFGDETFFDAGQGIAFDRHGSVHTVGVFADTIDCDPGAGVFNLAAPGNFGNSHTFVQKVDSSGNFVWARSVGGPLDDIGRGIDVNADGDVLVTGQFQDTADFDPGPDSFELTTLGALHAFVLQLDSMGDFHWAYDIGSDQSIFGNRGYGIVGLPDGSIYTTGNFVDTVDLDPGPATLLTGTTGGDDIYVQKVQKCYRSFTSIDSTVCGSLVWNGVSYDSTGVYRHYFQKPDGCDSVATLDLTILNSTSGTDVQTACDSFMWIDGSTYTSGNNTATHTLINAAGCDSIVTLNLTIDTVNPSVTQAGSALSANQSGASYQWLNCPAMTPITGAINQSYTAAVNGDYAAAVTNNGCADTSVCITVTGVGIPENNVGHGLLIFPNPAQQSFTVQLDQELLGAARLEVLNALGQTILTSSFNGMRKAVRIDPNTMPAGFYQIQVVQADRVIAGTRLVVQ